MFHIVGGTFVSKIPKNTKQRKGVMIGNDGQTQKTQMRIMLVGEREREKKYKMLGQLS